jgi:hypothetical protein
MSDPAVVVHDPDAVRECRARRGDSGVKRIEPLPLLPSREQSPAGRGGSAVHEQVVDGRDELPAVHSAEVVQSVASTGLSDDWPCSVSVGVGRGQRRRTSGPDGPVELQWSDDPLAQQRADRLARDPPDHHAEQDEVGVRVLEGRSGREVWGHGEAEVEHLARGPPASGVRDCTATTAPGDAAIRSALRTAARSRARCFRGSGRPPPPPSRRARRRGRAGGRAARGRRARRLRTAHGHNDRDHREQAKRPSATSHQPMLATVGAESTRRSDGSQDAGPSRSSVR